LFVDNTPKLATDRKYQMSKSPKKRTPAEELAWLCDFSITACVAHVSEFAPGTDYFKAAEADASVVIESLKQTPDLTGVIIDGMASVRRPGILDDSVVFYNSTEEEVLAHLEKVPSHDHVHWMFNKLLEIQDVWLGKFRKALPAVKIVYSADSDDLAATAERMLRVIVQSATVKASQTKKSLEEQRDELQARLDGPGKLTSSVLQAKLHELQSKRKKLVGTSGKSELRAVEADFAEAKEGLHLLAERERLVIKLRVNKAKKKQKLIEKTEAELVSVQAEISAREDGVVKALNKAIEARERFSGEVGKKADRDALDLDIKELRKSIEDIREKIAKIQTRMTKLEKVFKNLRESETSPVYGKRMTEHVRRLYKRFYALGQKHNVQVVFKPEVLVFGNLVIDYAHDRGRTWQPMPGRVRRLAESYHGMMTSYRENIAEALEEQKAATREVDVVMESGHHGVFFARWQKQELTPEEIRMQHVNTYYTGASDDVKHTVFIAGMPFEPQDEIDKYLKRQKPGRTRAGKPIASSSHPVFIRNSQKSVAGVTLVRKHNHGLISVEAIMYFLYRNKQVLEQFKGVMILLDSDNHLNSPEMDCPGTLGELALLDQLIKNPMVLYNQKIYVGGNLNLGDVSEANSKKWKEAVKFRRPVMEILQEIAMLVAGTDTSNPKSVAETALRWANDMMGGANESMKLNMRVTKWFLKEKFMRIYNQSPTRLRDIMAVLEGNHFADAVRDVGIQEFTLFEEWLIAMRDAHIDFPEKGRKPFPVRIEAGGEPQYFQPDNGKAEVVVHLGGYSSARQGIIEKFGVGHDGKLLVQAPCRVGLTHEPNAILNKARNQNADVTYAGHTHEFYVMADKSGTNKVRFIHQLGATQRVSATELMYGGLPRTSGVALAVIPRPGRYWTMMIPMNHMRRIGEAQRMVDAEAEVAKKNGKKKE